MNVKFTIKKNTAGSKYQAQGEMGLHAADQSIVEIKSFLNTSTRKLSIQFKTNKADDNLDDIEFKIRIVPNEENAKKAYQIALSILDKPDTNPDGLKSFLSMINKLELLRGDLKPDTINDFNRKWLDSGLDKLLHDVTFESGHEVFFDWLSKEDSSIKNALLNVSPNLSFSFLSSNQDDYATTISGYRKDNKIDINQSRYLDSLCSSIGNDRTIELLESMINKLKPKQEQ